MKTCVLFVLASLFLACGTPNMQIAIPDRFKEQAIQYPVKIAGTGEGRKPVRLGPYSTSRIKRGLLTTRGRYNRNEQSLLQENLLNLFQIELGSLRSVQRDKFEFSFTDGKQAVQVLAQEQEISEGARFQSNTRWVSEVYREQSFQYAFSARFIPQNPNQGEPWNLVMYSNYDWSIQQPFQAADFNEGGLLVTAGDTLTIKTVRVQRVIDKHGQEHAMPFAIPFAYEFRIGDEVCAIIDTWGKNLWLYKELDESTRSAIAAATTAILSRRIQNRVGAG
ncbi:hypothetical protein [Flavihumibacter cheonanensis]|uniref:hypothetical protein n=1 Tax=Flavihumibacter cheonanensis TaxID=1442385 RepID=UPI001EF912F3|nr:hypothetical protein [Flavihumibacter cheonanensis]MCG7750749.1 hypothetical protein [Flavihumibacter cheonanensis]